MKRMEIAPGVHLSWDPAQKFNRCRVSIHFALPAKRETATAHALLPLVMERGYADCPDMTQLTKKLARLYGADLTVDARPMGANHNLCVSVTGIKDRFALEGEPLTQKYAELALGTAFHPYFVGETFDPEAVNIEKQMLKKALEDEVNEKRLYCQRQANREFFGDSPAGVRQEGYLEEVDGLTARQLTDAYYEMLRAASIELIVLGCGEAQTEAVKNALLEELSPRVEQYSIDECFLDARGIGHCMDLEDFGRQLRGHVLSGTGLTIGVGFGATKTLAKSAQWASKEWPQFSGVLALSPENPRRTAKLLSLQPVEEIWGVGNRIAKKLHVMGITTALQLSLTNPTFIRKNFNVVLERTVRELNGESCISLEEAPPPKQQIVCSRSFGQRITTYEEMRQAVCQYAERAAEKLRGERQYCRHISTFIKTSPFAVNEPYYGNVATEKLNTPTRDTRDIIAAAVRSLDRIWLDGHRYAKAGIMLNDFSPNGVAQLNLFDDVQPRPHSDALMKVLDGINHSGLGKVWFAGRGIAPDWQMKREMLSPAYTTRWKELPVARF